MKTKISLVLLVPFLLVINIALGQGFKAPSPGKAVVYFTRVTHYGGAISFEFFHQDKYIGVFKGQNYMRYECDPDTNLFWISTENKEFITADLQEGGTYIVIVDVEMGWAKARVRAHPITPKSTEEFDRAKKMILSEPPKITPDEKIKEMNVKLADFIKEKLSMYENEWKNTKDFSYITPEMAIPIEAMK